MSLYLSLYPQVPWYKFITVLYHEPTQLPDSKPIPSQPAACKYHSEKSLYTTGLCTSSSQLYKHIYKYSPTLNQLYSPTLNQF